MAGPEFKPNVLVIVAVSASLLLIGCGGGGGGGDAGPASPAFGTAADGGAGATDGAGDDGTDSGTSGSVLPEGITASIMLDVDDDSDLDIVLGSQDGATSDTLLLNDGDGTFTKLDNAFPEHYLGAGGSTINFETSDFNSDGNADIIATTVEAGTYETARIHLYLGNGDGTFLDSTDSISAGDPDNWPAWIRVADFDNDGHTDFLLTVPGCPPGKGCFGGRIYLNDGSAGFAPAEITSTDAQQSYTDSRLIWESDGNTQAGQGSERVALDVLVADLNLDGLADLFAPNGGAAGPVATFINTSTPGNLSFDILYSYEADDVFSTRQFKNGVFIDINGDGFLDVIGSMSISFTTDATEPVLALLNRGDATFVFDDTVFAPSPPAVEHARQWLVADFDLNGSSDLFVADHGYDRDPFPGEKNLLLLSDGSGAMSDATMSSLSGEDTFTHGASIGDVNGDGYPDLFLNNRAGDNDERLWLNNGDGTFAETIIVVN